MLWRIMHGRSLEWSGRNREYLIVLAALTRQNRRLRLGSPGFGCSASVFDLYERGAEAAASHVDEMPPMFHNSEAKVLNLWNRANEAAVVRASLRWLDVGKAVIEVCDATEKPFWLIYPIDGQWQADEYDGTSHRLPTLKSALELIFPF